MNNIPQNDNELFKQFWEHYTNAFYNYNMTQFAQVSSVFKLPMPMPAKIKEIGDRYLKQFFDEVWRTSQQESQLSNYSTINNFMRSNQVPQPPPYNPPLQYNQFNQTPLNYEQAYSDGFNNYRQNQMKHFNPPPYQKYHDKGQGYKRGGYQNADKQNWVHGKQSYTRFSDDESSERAASGIQRSNSNQANNFNKRAANRLGFADDSD